MAMLNNQRVPVITPVVTAGGSGVIMVLADGWFRCTFSVSMCRRPPIRKKSRPSKAMKAETFLHLRLTQNEGNIWPHWAVWIRTPCKRQKKGWGDSCEKGNDAWSMVNINFEIGWRRKTSSNYIQIYVIYYILYITHIIQLWDMVSKCLQRWWCPEVSSKSANLRYPAKEKLPN